MPNYCTNCGSELPHGARYCSRCGFAAGATPPAYAAPAYAAPGSMPGPTPPSEAAAIVALLVNVLFMPGLGTVIVGRQEGWWQLALFWIGVPLSLLLVGIPLIIGAWIWALVSGVQALQDANAAARAARGPAVPPPY